MVSNINNSNSFLKNVFNSSNGNKWMYSTFVTIIIILLQTVYSLSNESISNKIYNHTENKEIHVPYSALTHDFVPRTELEKMMNTQFENINKQLINIDKRLERIEGKK